MIDWMLGKLGVEVFRAVVPVERSQAGKYATRRLQHIKYQAGHIKQWLEKTEAPFFSVNCAKSVAVLKELLLPGSLRASP